MKKHLELITKVKENGDVDIKMGGKINRTTYLSALDLIERSMQEICVEGQGYNLHGKVKVY